MKLYVDHNGNFDLDFEGLKVIIDEKDPAITVGKELRTQDGLTHELIVTGVSEKKLTKIQQKVLSLFGITKGHTIFVRENNRSVPLMELKSELTNGWAE